MIAPKSESDNLVNQSQSNVKWNECERRETGCAWKSEKEEWVEKEREREREQTHQVSRSQLNIYC